MLKITCACGLDIKVSKHEVKLTEENDKNAFAGIKCPKCGTGIGIWVFDNSKWDIGKANEMKIEEDTKK